MLQRIMEQLLPSSRFAMGAIVIAEKMVWKSWLWGNVSKYGLLVDEPAVLVLYTSFCTGAKYAKDTAGFVLQKVFSDF